MRRLLIFVSVALSACASNPGLVRAETECVSEIRITSLTNEFGDGPVTGCAKRDYTGRFFLAGTRNQVNPDHIIVQSGTPFVAERYWSLYGIGEIR